MNKIDLLKNNKKEIVRLSQSGMSNKQLGEIYKCSAPYIGSFLKKECGVKSKCVGSYHVIDFSNCEDDIIREYKAGKSILQISKERNIDIKAIKKLLESKGFDGKKIGELKGLDKLKNYFDEIVTIYLEEKIGVDTIAKRFGVSGSTIRRIVKMYGVMRDYKYYQYNIDECYFEKIDSRNKAYVLGLMYSDGNVTYRDWRIKLNKQDLYIIENIKQEIQFDGPVVFRKMREYKKGNIVSITNASCGLSIARKKMVADLINLGCFENKTWKLRFPTEKQVPQQFIADFLRGYCDGDGSIGKKSCNISFIGNKFFIKEMINFLPFKQIPIMKYQQSKKYPDDVDKQLLIFCAGKKYGAIEILQFLYGDCADSLYLPRKRDLALYWLDKSRGKK